MTLRLIVEFMYILAFVCGFVTGGGGDFWMFLITFLSSDRVILVVVLCLIVEFCSTKILSSKAKVGCLFRNSERSLFLEMLSER